MDNSTRRKDRSLRERRSSWAIADCQSVQWLPSPSSCSSHVNVKTQPCSYCSCSAGLCWLLLCCSSRVQSLVRLRTVAAYSRFYIHRHLESIRQAMAALGIPGQRQASPSTCDTCEDSSCLNSAASSKLQRCANLIFLCRLSSSLHLEGPGALAHRLRVRKWPTSRHCLGCTGKHEPTRQMLTSRPTAKPTAPEVQGPSASPTSEVGGREFDQRTGGVSGAFHEQNLCI